MTRVPTDCSVAFASALYATTFEESIRFSFPEDAGGGPLEGGREGAGKAGIAGHLA